MNRPEVVEEFRAAVQHYQEGRLQSRSFQL